MWLKSPVTRGSFVVASGLIACSLLWPTACARQGSSEGGDQNVIVNRRALHQVADELSLVRDSISETLQRLEREFLEYREQHPKFLEDEGPKDQERALQQKAMESNLERQRKDFNRVVDQIKTLNKLADPRKPVEKK